MLFRSDENRPGQPVEQAQRARLAQQAAERQDLSGYYKLNLEFHESLMKIASNQTLADLYLSIVRQTHLFRRRGLVQQGSLKTSNEEHGEIVQALARGDAVAAEQSLTRHVARGWERLAAAP